MRDDAFRTLAGRVLAVTGASGYIGSALVERLLSLNVQVMRVGRTALPARQGCIDIIGQLEQRQCWEQVLEKADGVFHLAGNTSVYAAKKDPAFSLRSTLLPLNHLIGLAHGRREAVDIVFASTATVYGMARQARPEDDGTEAPVTIYDQHKLFAERQLQLATAQGVLKAVNLRLCNVYGPSTAVSGAKDRGILNRVCRMALAGDAITVFGDGDYLRDYVYIDDVVDTFVAAMALPDASGDSFLVSTGQGVTLGDAFRLAARLAEEKTGKEVPVLTTDWPADADPIEFRSFIGDTRKFAQTFGWCPQTRLQDGLRETLTAFSSDSGEKNR